VSPAAGISDVSEALKHCFRVGLIEHVVTRAPVSPSQFADLYHETFRLDERTAIADVAYHARALAKLGVFEIVSFDPGLRGTDHRLYGLKGRLGRRTSDVLQGLRGDGFFLSDSGEGAMFALARGEIVRVARAIGHPKRVAIVCKMSAERERYSPARWARECGATPQSVAYHFRTLDSLGVAPVVDTIETRGGKEHLHELNGPLAAAVVASLDLLQGRADYASDLRIDTRTETR
jgi:hypothetical protein